jgi:hypothetical protein
MEIENKTGRFIPVKMKAIDPNSGFNIKEVFLERNIILKLKVLF